MNHRVYAWLASAGLALLVGPLLAAELTKGLDAYMSAMLGYVLYAFTFGAFLYWAVDIYTMRQYARIRERWAEEKKVRQDERIDLTAAAEFRKLHP